jgi:hypothetical protein
MKLTELNIQQVLWRDLQSGNSIVMSNYTPKGWWECDMFAITKSGYWSEHEIKLSVSDFKADARKEYGAGMSWVDGQWKERPAINKHELLQTGSLKGPSRFWYVLAESIADQCAVPNWAGIKVARVSSGRIFISIKRPAPLMHKQKCDKKIADHAQSVAYWRYWNLKNDLVSEVNRQIARITASDASSPS